VSEPIERPVPESLSDEQIDAFVRVHARRDPIGAPFIGAWMREEITIQEAGRLTAAAKAAANAEEAI